MMRTVFVSLRKPPPEDFTVAGLAVRFLVNVAALWAAQWVVRGFDIEGASALFIGALIFGVLNALIRPVIALVSCPLTVLTLGFFTLIINTIMLALTAWVAGWFDLKFEVDGFIAAFLGALIISIVSTLLSAWAGRAVLDGRRRRPRVW